VVQERGVGGADLHDGAERLVAVLRLVGLEHTDGELILSPGVGQLERPDDHADELGSRAFGQILRRHPPREGDGEGPQGLRPFRRHRGGEELQDGGGQSARGHLVRGAHAAHGTRARTGPRPAASGKARTGRRMRGWPGPSGPSEMVETSNRMSGSVEEHELRSVAQLRMLHALATRLNALDDVAAIGEAITTELKTLIDYHNC